MVGRIPDAGGNDFPSRTSHRAVDALFLDYSAQIDRRKVIGPNEQVIRMPNDQTFLQEFEVQRWPLDQWHHRDHLKLAYLYLRRYPLDEAAAKIRDGIKAHNAAHDIP